MSRSHGSKGCSRTCVCRVGVIRVIAAKDARRGSTVEESEAGVVYEYEVYDYYDHPEDEPSLPEPEQLRVPLAEFVRPREG